MALRDRAEFTSFYEASAPAVLRQVHAMTGDHAEAQDCVQEAYVRAWQHWDRVSSYDAPEAWVRTVAWRLAVSRFRRVRRGAALLRQEPHVSSSQALGPDHVALVQALRQIKPDQRRAIVLHYVAGRSVQEIADETHAPTGTVKARLRRGRDALAVLLAETDLEHRRG